MSIANLVNRFDERPCGCIVRGDGQWLHFCIQHGKVHRDVLFARKPGMTSTGAEKKHRGQGHTAKTHGSESRRHANHMAREEAMGNLKSKVKRA